MSGGESQDDRPTPHGGPPRGDGGGDETSWETDLGDRMRELKPPSHAPPAPLAQHIESIREAAAGGGG